MSRAQNQRARKPARALAGLHLINPELSRREQGPRLNQSNPILQVIDEHEAAEILNLSVDTLRRLVRSGDGPLRVNLSARRIGYRLGDLADWLDKRATSRD